jgi:hypothetical protein
MTRAAPHCPPVALVVEQQFHRLVIGDKGATGIKGGQLVGLTRMRRGLAGDGQA